MYMCFKFKVEVDFWSKWYSIAVLQPKEIQLTPDNSNPRLLEPCANSNQNRFPLDFHHTFTVILPSVTRTLDNLELPLTWTNFCFPSGHFLYNFTLDNSNHVLSS